MYNKNMELVFLGSGTSHGVPIINCNCKVCTSTDKRDRRYRSSVYIKGEKGTCLLVDCGQEFRLQAIENRISKIDSVLLTHAHADHVFGLDDLRIFSCAKQDMKDTCNHENIIAPPIPVYLNKEAKKVVEHTFGYLFTPVMEGGGKAKIQLNDVKESFTINEFTVTPVPMMHGHLPTYGWIVNKMAYLTDCNYISDNSFALMNKTCPKLDYLIIDGLRETKHSTHFSFLQALEAADRIAPKNVYLTHLTHLFSHEEVNEYIKNHLYKFPNLQKAVENGGVVEAAYDGLKLYSKD